MLYDGLKLERSGYVRVPASPGLGVTMDARAERCLAVA